MSAARRHESGVTRGDLRAEILAFDDVTVGYGGVPVLDGASFNVRRGEIAGLVALDGRGRSTVVKCAAGLLPPASGEVRYEMRDIYDMSFGEDQRYRARSAVVLEGGALLVNRTIFENVALPLRYHLAMKGDDLELFVDRLLLKVGYTESPDALPWQVSGRARKLAAIARALVREPELVIIDRFFEGLDAPDAKRIMELLLELNVKSGTSFLVVGELSSHIFQVAERVVVLEGGRVVAHDFKRGLFKIEKIKKAFEEGEAEFPANRATRALGPAVPVPDAGPPSDLAPLVTDSRPFSPDEDSDQQPVVVLEPPPSRRAKKPRRSSTFAATASPAATPTTPATPASSGEEGPGDSNATANLSPEAAAEIVKKARERAAERAASEELLASEAPSQAPRASAVSERRETPLKAARSDIEALESEESERTVTLDPDATAELARQARERAAARLERESALADHRDHRERPNEREERELLQSEVVAEFHEARKIAAEESGGPEFTERPTRELGSPVNDPEPPPEPKELS